MAARITPRGTHLDIDTPTVLFALPAGPFRGTIGNIMWYGASLDGQRFLINTLVDDVPPITMLLNWKPKG